MEIVGAVLAGLFLLILHVLTFAFMIGKIKRKIVCTETVDAWIDSVTLEETEYEDSKTGEVKREDSYSVVFIYDYYGQTYKSSHLYSKHCRYISDQYTKIKINPHNPRESWTKGELRDVLILSLAIPLYAFFDYLYIICVF